MCALLIAVVSVSAYLTDYAASYNAFTIGHVKDDIIEDFDAPEKISEGDVISKQVQIENKTDNDEWVRAKLIYSDEALLDYVTPNYVVTVWEYNDEDGYWYYPYELNPNSKTIPFMTSVSVKSGVSQDVLDAFGAFTIDVYTESIEYDGETSYEEAWEDFYKNK